MLKNLLNGGSLAPRKISGIGLSLLLGLASLSSPALSEPLKELKVPTNTSTSKRVSPQYDYQPDTLLVAPDAKAEGDDVKEALEQVHGTVVGTIGHDKLRILIVRTEKGKLEETEKKLGKDKKLFAAIGRNYRIHANLVPNDPDFPKQWHLTAINCPKAWNASLGRTKIAIFDTGCQASIPDLQGKTERGFDATTAAAQTMGVMAMTGAGVVPGLSDLAGAFAEAASAGAQTDGNGHGTWVATTAAATLNDRAAGCGVAPGAKIYPIRIADAPRGNEATTWDAEVAAAMVVAKDSGARIVNISYNAPYVGFHNAALHAPLHLLFADFYATRNGLIFMSSGNDGVFDPTPPVPYLNLVSGIDPTGQLADFGNGKGANWGPAVKFTAPATGIWVSDIDGQSVRVQGTSFSSPIVAAEAALIWERNSALPNFMVEQYLRNSCVSLSGSPFNMYYGWGMPDAQKAVGL